MVQRQRPNQVVFYASKEAQEILKEMEPGGRSEFINRAIAFYHERQRKGAVLFAMEKAYEYLKFTPSPEAEAVRKELRNILWRRGDTPTSVVARIIRQDGSCIVDQFTDTEKAMMLVMEQPDCIRYEIYNQQHKPVAVAFRTDNGAFAFDYLAENALDKAV